MIRITDESVQPFEQKHISKVREIAPECTLFLKRSNEAFPIQPGKIALYGSGARRTIKGGTGSGDVNVRHYVTVEEGLEKAGFTITSKYWMNAYDELLLNSRAPFIERVKAEAAELGVNAAMYGMGKAMPEPEYEFKIEADGDTAIYVLARNSGEGADRSVVSGDINLSEAEIRDILICRQRYEKFLLVLNVGGIINLESVMEVENILLLSQLGTPVGDVLADILLGKSYPSGKLTTTWAPIELYPSTKEFKDMDDTRYKEGIYVGYRYFNTAGIKPTFPFGFGLSYTTFSTNIVDVTVNAKEVNVTVKVTNTGTYRGKEVVQLYSSSPQGALNQPFQELRTFAKTKELEPGQSEDLRLNFATKDMASYDVMSASYILESGDYILRVGNSSMDTSVCGVINLDTTALIKKCKNICDNPDVETIQLQIDNDEHELQTLKHFYLKASDFKTETVKYSQLPEEIISDTKCNFDDVKSGKATLDDFVDTLSNEQLVLFGIGLHDPNGGMGSMIGAASKSVAGGAGETTDTLQDYKVPTLVMADGPAGIRVCKQYKIVGSEVKAMDNPLAGMMEFMDPEQLKMMAEMMPAPAEEELSAPINYMYCIAIPIGTALAQTFNRNACMELGDIIGEEMEMFGINLWLAPAMNIHRSPLCGRDFEYYSEDPVVSGKIAAAINNGVAKHKGCGTTIKHFALNNQETNRVASNSVADERTIREIYLRNFEICLKESAPATIMSSYNLVNGLHTNNSRELLTDVLRDEWQYEGFVMTDWYAVGSMMTDGNGRLNKHQSASGAGCVYAGNDLIMPGMTDDYNEIIEAIDNDEAPYKINRAMLQTNAKRILQVILKFSNGDICE